MPSIDDDDHNNLLPTDNAGFDRPVPRQPKSPAKLAQLQAQNRRREYLRRHESYFNSLEHELAGEFKKTFQKKNEMKFSLPPFLLSLSHNRKDSHVNGGVKQSK